MSMRPYIRTLVTTIFFLFFTYVNAAATTDHYDNSGKIYTVIICAIMVILAMVFYLFYIERRVKKLEGRIRDEEDITQL